MVLSMCLGVAVRDDVPPTGRSGDVTQLHLYGGTTVDFIGDATRNRIAEKLERSFFDHFRYEAPKNEVRSWRNSLRAMSASWRRAASTTHGIVLEYQLPLTSRRLDCMVTGTDTSGTPGGVIVELKQWEEARVLRCRRLRDDVLGGAPERQVLHPSRRSASTALPRRHPHGVLGRPGRASRVFVSAQPSARRRRGASRRPLPRPSGAWPLYPSESVDDLISYLDANVGAGDGVPVLDRVLDGKFRPHKKLLDHTAQMIKDEPTYVLLDEQQVVFNDVLAKVRASQRVPTARCSSFTAAPVPESR